MSYDPKPTQFPFPEDTSTHYLPVPIKVHTVFDENYPYVDRSKGFKFKRFWFNFVLRVLVFLIVRIRLNLRINGKKNLKTHKKLLKNGCVTVCNHIHMWDFLGIMTATNNTHFGILAWPTNILGPNRKMIRMIGGIPVPDTNLKAYKKWHNDVMDLLNDGKWLHVYAEGSMWEFYKPIRPLKDGGFRFAIEANKPVLPMAYSYRENGWIRKKIFKSPASLTLNIGEPMFAPDIPDKKLQRETFMKQVHAKMCELADIDPKENIYEPIYNNSKRIDYYTDKYGEGYKTSW